MTEAEWLAADDPTPMLEFLRGKASERLSVQRGKTYPDTVEADMAEHETKTLSLEQRMEVFLALVEAQDGPMTVAQSRKAVAERFGVTDQQVRQIEREGLDGNWPPLG